VRAKVTSVTINCVVKTGHMVARMGTYHNSFVGNGRKWRTESYLAHLPPPIPLPQPHSITFLSCPTMMLPLAHYSFIQEFQLFVPIAENLLSPYSTSFTSLWHDTYYGFCIASVTEDTSLNPSLWLRKLKLDHRSLLEVYYLLGYNAM
jgi:hypothetical protein